jgi:hypothetical protein
LGAAGAGAAGAGASAPTAYVSSMVNLKMTYRYVNGQHKNGVRKLSPTSTVSYLLHLPFQLFKLIWNQKKYAIIMLIFSVLKTLYSLIRVGAGNEAIAGASDGVSDGTGSSGSGSAGPGQGANDSGSATLLRTGKRTAQCTYHAVYDNLTLDPMSGKLIHINSKLYRTLTFKEDKPF